LGGVFWLESGGLVGEGGRPMGEQLEKTYEPGRVEREWYDRWLEAGCFRGDEKAQGEGYSIVIPPPNVTGILHLGHVLNNTIQDILARRARQQGKAVLWLPGTDHAGIATQTRVERKLREEEGVGRRDLGREAFLERVWEWKEEHGGIIFEQLKRLGCSCDWGRERFTLDAEYSRWVAQVFVELFEEGLIYRGRRMVNWCPASLTALSDEEVVMKEQDSQLYTMRYEVVGQEGRFVEISTTRPETLMGDTAVAVHPRDPRYADLVGGRVRRPFPEAEIPVVADEHIDMEFGTGVLKVTPAHDRADYEIGQRHGLEAIDVLTPDGRINCPEVTELHGLDRAEARKKAAEMLDGRGLLVGVENYRNSVGFSERADVPIEPRLSMQWFLRYPAVEAATEAVRSGEIAFRPERWQKTYLHWMENLQDWCISRQLWWGHRVPVWYRKEEAVELREASLGVADRDAGKIYVGVDGPAEQEGWEQDEDVLDTWFSSWLWPFATMGDVGEDSETLEKFYPTSDLVTGPDIIFFWVARMIMAGYRFRGERPFARVFFTSLIRDAKGRKLSKSLGNSPDPLQLFERYGADGVRFGLLRIAPTGTDVRYDEGRIEEGRNFATKLWNACRFRQMYGEAGELVPGDLSIYDIDILAKLDVLGEELEAAYAGYRFNDVCSLLYEFLWSNFCDLYLEACKGRLRGGGAGQAAVLSTIDLVLERTLQHLHPLMPHLTEELAHKLGYVGEGEFLMGRELALERATGGIEEVVVVEARSRVAAVYGTAARVRNLKAELGLGARRDVEIWVRPAVDWVEEEGANLGLLAGVGAVHVDGGHEAAGGTPAALTELGEVFLPLEGLIDREAERARLDREIGKVEMEVKKAEGKLGNASFVDRAPAEVVATERARLEEWRGKLARLREMRGGL